MASVIAVHTYRAYISCIRALGSLHRLKLQGSSAEDAAHAGICTARTTIHHSSLVYLQGPEPMFQSLRIFLSTS